MKQMVNTITIQPEITKKQKAREAIDVKVSEERGSDRIQDRQQEKKLQKRK